MVITDNADEIPDNSRIWESLGPIESGTPCLLSKISISNGTTANQTQLSRME
jgi:hypothetical protein